MEAATGHGPAESPLPRGRRCPVAHPWRKRHAGLANPSQRPASKRSSAGPGCSPLPRPVSGHAGVRAGGSSSQAQAEGLARPRSRPPPGLRRKRGLWRGGAAAPRQGPGLPAPCRAPGSWRLPSRDGPPLVNFSPVHARGVVRPEPMRVQLAVHLLVAHTEPPPGSQAPAPKLATPASTTSRTQRRQPQPLSKP